MCKEGEKTKRDIWTDPFDTNNGTFIRNKTTGELKQFVSSEEAWEFLDDNEN